MKRLTSALILIGALGFGPAVAATPAFAAPPDDSAQAQSRFRSRLSDRQVQAILARIRTNSEALLRAIEGTPPRGRIYGANRAPGDVSYLLDDLIRATMHLDDHVTRALTIRADVDDVLRRAGAVDQALSRVTQTRAVQSSWDTIRRDVDSLANAYDLRWDWRNPEYSTDPLTGVYRELTGTYELDAARSDDPARTINAALRNVPAADRTRATRQLNNRLDPPQRIAIDRTEDRILIASSHGPQFAFEADGRPHTEQGAAGRSVTTRASVFGDQLDVTTTGVADSEFGVTFEPLRNGDELRVTRRIYTDALNQPVSLQSIYRRTSATPDWELYNRTGTTRPSARPGRLDAGVLVPDGTVLVARLDQTVNFRNAREDDRVTLTVRNAPTADLEGATIEGTIIAVPVGTTDRTQISMQFDTIRLRSGRFGEFDGIIERITSPNGQTIRFDGEQATVNRDKSEAALRRGAIGAVIGGLIGAIAGGGEGAVIGAAIGGGGAAATVLIDNTGERELLRGTEFTIRAEARR